MNAYSKYRTDWNSFSRPNGKTVYPLRLQHRRAIVILGAISVLHLPFGNEMLFIGADDRSDRVHPVGIRPTGAGFRVGGGLPVLSGKGRYREQSVNGHFRGANGREAAARDLCWKTIARGPIVEGQYRPNRQRTCRRTFR